MASGYPRSSLFSRLWQRETPKKGHFWSVEAPMRKWTVRQQTIHHNMTYCYRTSQLAAGLDERAPFRVGSGIDPISRSFLGIFGVRTGLFEPPGCVLHAGLWILEIGPQMTELWLQTYKWPRSRHVTAIRWGFRHIWVTTRLFLFQILKFKNEHGENVTTVLMSIGLPLDY